MTVLLDYSWPGGAADPAGPPIASTPGEGTFQRFGDGTGGVSTNAVFSTAYDENHSATANHKSTSYFSAVGGRNGGPAVCLDILSGACFFIQNGDGVNIRFYWTNGLGSYLELGNTPGVFDTTSAWTLERIADLNLLRAYQDDVQLGDDVDDDTLTGGEPGTTGYDDAQRWSRLVYEDDSIGGGGPEITGVDDATPEHTSTLVITGTGFLPAQGSGEADIDGGSQVETSWSDTEIEITVDRNDRPYGVPVDLVVTNNDAEASAPFALTSLQPQSGWSFVNVGTPNPDPDLRLTSAPDLATGDQIAYDNKGGLVTVYDDGTVSADPSVESFDFEVWSAADEEWGALATQYMYVLAIDQAQETNTALPLTGRAQVAIGLATETDTAQALSAAAPALGLASETDTAQPMAGRAQLAIGLASETDSAQPLTGRAQLALGQALEADTAQPLAGRAQLAIGLASETDSAQPVTIGAAGVLGIASETDTAQPLTGRAQLGIGLASEADSALPFTGRQARAIGPASETDSAQPLTGRAQLAIGLAQETDTAHAVQTGSAIAGQAVETNTALPLTGRVAKVIGQAVETDTAQPVQRLGSAVIGLATETDAAQPLTGRQVAAIGLAEELDSALALRPATVGFLGLALDLEIALPVSWAPVAQIGQAVETDTAQAVTNPDLREPLLPPPLSSTVAYATAVAFVAKFGMPEAVQLLADEERLLTAQLLEDILRGTWTGNPSNAEQNAAIQALDRLQRQLVTSSNFMAGYLRTAATLPLQADDANAGTLEDCCLALTRHAIADDCENATDRMDKTAEQWRTWLKDVARGTVQLVGGDGEPAPARARSRKGRMNSSFDWGSFPGGGGA